MSTQKYFRAVAIEKHGAFTLDHKLKKAAQGVHCAFEEVH